MPLKKTEAVIEDCSRIRENPAKGFQDLRSRPPILRLSRRKITGTYIAKPQAKLIGMDES